MKVRITAWAVEREIQPTLPRGNQAFFLGCMLEDELWPKLEVFEHHNQQKPIMVASTSASFLPV